MSTDEIKVLHHQTLKKLVNQGADSVARRKKRDEQILELRKAGLTVEEIAKQIGLSKQRVSQIIIKLSNE